MFQSWRKAKIRKDDKLYSEIIRFGKKTCQRCGKQRQLQCCHIIERGHEATRVMLTPVVNAIALCALCHDWFDRHKMHDLLFDPSRRVHTSVDESFTFLVGKCGYSWADLTLLYALSRKSGKRNAFTKGFNVRVLSEFLRKLQVGVVACLAFYGISCEPVPAFSEPDFNRIADAIWFAEGGAKTKYPYGIKSIRTGGDTVKARQICLNTIRRNYSRWNGHGNFIDFLADRYCPLAVDRHGNENWKRNVRFFLGRLAVSPKVVTHR